MIDAINAMATFNPSEKSKRKVITRETSLNSDYIKDLLDVAVEEPDYGTNECSPILRLRMRIDPVVSDTSCCDEGAIISYCGSEITPPPPIVEEIGGIVAQIKAITTTSLSPLPWTVGKIPRFCIVQLSVKRIGYPEYFIDLTGMNLSVGYIPSLVSGNSYEFKYRIRGLNDSSSCWSNWSEVVNYNS